MDRVVISKALWHRIQQAEQTRNVALAMELIWCAAVCLEVPVGWAYNHEDGWFAPIGSQVGTIDLSNAVRNALNARGSYDPSESDSRSARGSVHVSSAEERSC